MVERVIDSQNPTYEGFFFLGRTKTVANHRSEIQRLVNEALGIDLEKIIVTVAPGQFLPVRRKARQLAESIAAGKVLVMIESPDGFFTNDAVVYEDEVCGTIQDHNSKIDCDSSIVVAPLSNQLGPRPKSGKIDLLDRICGPWGLGLLWLCGRAIAKKIPLEFVFAHRRIPHLINRKVSKLVQ